MERGVIVNEDKSYCVVLRRFNHEDESFAYDIVASEVARSEANDFIRSRRWRNGDILIRIDMAYVSRLSEYAKDIYVAGSFGEIEYVGFSDISFGAHWPQSCSWIQAWEESDVGGDELISEACLKGVDLRRIVGAAQECAIIAANTAGINEGRLAYAMDILKMWTGGESVNISTAHQMMIDSSEDYFSVDKNERVYEACLSCLNAVTLASVSGDGSFNLTAADSISYAAMVCSQKYDMEFFAGIVRKHIPLHVLLKSVVGI